MDREFARAADAVSQGAAAGKGDPERAVSQIQGAILPTIRPAERGDAQTLTTLMHQSSAYAGNYASILDGYAVTPGQIDRDIFYVADHDGAIAGFYSLTLGDEPELDLMFVADQAQGTGLGAKLFEHMVAQARQHGVTALTIVSHPPSVGFYQRMGATIVGTKPPNMKARWERPILRLALSEPGVDSGASGRLQAVRCRKTAVVRIGRLWCRVGGGFCGMPLRQSADQPVADVLFVLICGSSFDASRQEFADAARV